MSSSRKPLAALALLLVLLTGVAHAQSYPGIGRPATPKEVAAWDIDVRADFKGLPKGSGSVLKGQEVWEAKCASCHGVFGESNQVFMPLVGGTSAADVKSGRAARLTDITFPGRTTLMKMSTVSTLWDYINRAMPWTQPKSLTVEEVYATTAYLLHLGEVVPENFVLSDANIAEVQKRLPNRNGHSTDHGLWPGRSKAEGGMGNGGKPDVRAAACMTNCETEPKVASFLPQHARNNHGNLAEQQRAVGPQRGVDTTAAPGAASAAPAATSAARPAAPAPAKAIVPTALLQKHTCTACHGMDSKIVGPGFREIGQKHGGRSDALAYLYDKIRKGSQGVWGAIPMPPQSLPDNDAKAIAQWLAEGAK